MSARLAGALLVSVALLLRVLVALPVLAHPERSVSHGMDANQYDALGRNLADHGVFSRDLTPPYSPEIYRTPGYPLLVAGFYRLFGPNPIPVLVFQILISAFVAWFTWLIVRRRTGQEWPAWIAGFLLAVSPNLCFYTAYLMSETLFGAVLILIAGAILLGRPQSWLLRSVLIGLATGVLVLIRPIAVWYPAVLMLLFWLDTRKFTRTAAMTAAVVLSCLLVLTPWLLRNQARFGRPVLSTVNDVNLLTYGGATVLARTESISIDSARTRLVHESAEEMRVRGTDSSNQVAAAAIWGRVGRRYMLRNPAAYAVLHLTGLAVAALAPLPGSGMIIHFGGTPPSDVGSAIPTFVKYMAGLKPGQAFRVLTTRITQGIPPAAVIVFIFALLLQILIIVSSIVGLTAQWPRKDGLLLLFLVLTTCYFLAWPGSAGESRFRIPVEPFIAVLAALGLESIRRRSNKSPTGAA